MLLKITIPKNRNCQYLGCAQNFPVFLHQKNAFIYSTAVGFMGISMEYGVPGSTIFLSVNKQVKNNLDKCNDRCNSGITYPNFIQCLEKRRAEEIKECVLPWRNTAIKR